MNTVYLALGGNLGDRLAALRKASSALAQTSALRLEDCSPVFETDAVAEEPQPPYLNAAVRAKTDFSPRALLEYVLSIEQVLGRFRPLDRPKASRVLDIDVLLYEDMLIDEPGLRVPHPALLVRPFVRIPLACVAISGLRHPCTGDLLDTYPPHPSVRPFSGTLISLGPSNRSVL